MSTCAGEQLVELFHFFAPKKMEPQRPEDTLRFYSRFWRLIRDRGWNVSYVDDVCLSGRSDEEVLAFAWKEQRILLTHDFDFLDDSRFPFQRNPGPVVLPGGIGSTLGLAEAINGVLALIGPYAEAYRGYKIRITEDGVWTIRRFNTEKGIHQEIHVKFGKINCGSGIDDKP